MGKPSPHIESGTGAAVAPPPLPDDEDAALDDELLLDVDELPLVVDEPGMVAALHAE
jgi:hypothetical protein